MEKDIRMAITDKIVETAGKFYGVDFTDIKYIGGFENFVYEYEKDGKLYILRLAHSDHREYNQILAEIEFIDYLSNNGAMVSEVVKSDKASLCEKVMIDDDKYFTVTAFTKAPGDFVKRSEQSPDFFTMFGKAVGKLHTLAKDYQPTHKRAQWYEETLFKQLKENLVDEDKVIYDKLVLLMNEIKALPKDRNSYGLIHTDLHFHNMYFYEDSVTIFDWDDASYKHFISDIAIIIFYMYGFDYSLDNDVKGDKTYQLLKHFCKGYLQINDLDYSWFDHLLKFLKLREIVLYFVIKMETEEFKQSKFAQNYLGFYRDRILNDVPFLNINRALGNNRNN